MSTDSPGPEAQGPVVVGYDGREESERALEYALEEAASREVPVVVIVVAAMPYEYVDPYGPGVPGMIGPMTPIPQEGPLEVQPLLDHARRRIEETGSSGEAVWGLGDPVTEILRVADERKAAAIVVGTHHHSALGRFFGTDTAADLVRESHCDVLVAR
jgi:nucleotide-binding universal stress UspA family protein